MKILIIESNADIVRKLKTGIESDKFKVTVADKGLDGIELARRYSYDLILLGQTLPDMSGVDVLGALRAAYETNLVLVLKCDHETETDLKAMGFDADGFLTLPLNMPEVEGELKTHIHCTRRARANTIHTGPIELDLYTDEIFVNDRLISTSGKEYELFKFLCLQKGKAFSQTQLSRYLYDKPEGPELNNISVFITKIRRKLADATGGYHPIEMHTGRGFMVHDPKGRLGRDQKLG